MSELVPQLPLALHTPPEQRLSRYIDAPSGLPEALHALATGASANGVYLHGAHATGKTHLLLATCAEAEVAGLRAAYLALRGLRGRLRAATEGLEVADLLALDDVDAVAGSREDEIALFDLHNRLHDAGRAATAESTAFRDWFRERAEAGDWDALFDYRRQAPHAALMHPSDEHLLPFYVAAGAAGRQPALRLHASVTHGDLGMDAYAFGARADVLRQALGRAEALPA